MAELNSKELLSLVNTTQVRPGDERVRKITARVVSDLFHAIEDLEVSPDEFWAGVKWLTRLGQAGMVGLITAGLGFDRLLDIMMDEQDRRVGRATGTPRAIEGPLYIGGAPIFQSEVRLDEGNEGQGQTFVMEGFVLDVHGQPVAGACVDVWHCNQAGRYSHFDPSQPEYNLRRRIMTGEQGAYRFRTFIPPGYSIPPDSPVSELFEKLGRHGNRPAHIHFLVSGTDKRALTTQINIPGDTFLDDDFGFATRDGLVVSIEDVASASGYESLGVSGPFKRARFDFVLADAHSAVEALARSRYETEPA